MTPFTAPPCYHTPAGDLTGEKSLIAQIERSHALLSLLSLVEPERLSEVGCGFDLVIQETLATLERIECHLHKEKRLVDLFCEGTRERS